MGNSIARTGVRKIRDAESSHAYFQVKNLPTGRRPTRIRQREITPVLPNESTCGIRKISAHARVVTRAVCINGTSKCS